MLQHMPAIMPLLLSPSGRIGRRAFCLGSVLLTVAALVAERAVVLLSDGAGIMAFLFVALIAWSAGALSRKRLHDLGLSGIVIAKFLGLYIALVLIAPMLSLFLDAPASLATPLIAGPAGFWIVWLTVAPGQSTRGGGASDLPATSG
jgi:uncharacterized membrane protein YhaH (DUF805 family)